MIAPPTSVAGFGRSANQRKIQIGTNTVSLWAKIVMATAGTDRDAMLNRIVPITIRTPPWSTAYSVSSSGGRSGLLFAVVTTTHSTIIIDAYPDRTGDQSRSGPDRMHTV